MSARVGGLAPQGVRPQRSLAAERRRLIARYFSQSSGVGPVRAPVGEQWLRGLDREQQLAVELALSPGPGALVLTGEAGAGKTETLRALAAALKSQHRGLMVLAVAHRALHVVRSRLAGSRNVGYATLARVMVNPLILRTARLVVIEEASMVDDGQLSAVIRALAPNARLLLVGDPNQLPPINSGTPLVQAIESGVPVVRLQGQYRQAAGNGVAEFARAIRDGRALKIPPSGVRLHCGLERPEERLVRLMLSAQRRGSDSLVLTWRRDDWIGANVALQRCLNPHGEPVGTTMMRGTVGSEHSVELRVGDRIASSVNLTAVDFYNGMTGRLVSVAGDRLTVRLEDGREVELPVGVVPSLELGYCLTAHRAQGGEWPQVVIYQPGEVRNYPARWFYTAASRARKRLDVVTALDRTAWWGNVMG